MKETFTRQQWVEYTTELAPVELKIAMDRHTRTCGECAAILERFAEVDRELIAAVAILRESIPVSEWSAERAYDARQRRLPVREADDLEQRIVRLQLFLAPICGFGTAQRAMLVAAGRSAAASVEVLTDVEWPAFVKHLSSIVGALCGEPAGRLLWYLGQAILTE